MSAAVNDQGLSRKHLMASIDASLRRLGTDYVDLYIIHAFDAQTPVEETMDALHAIVRRARRVTSVPRRCMPGDSRSSIMRRKGAAERHSATCSASTISCIARRSVR